ncbi:biopolymer transporter ExbD [Limnohabitans sp. B9-3]|uniref:ExbD/TolR family protein n=1 Tax=Limnohabitans sp. B9-3 TaxID=1100707 RepID=UPI000C1E5596|nr:biopolymer transporter ExbD [Limnohabitans sp. B9-3]PIT71705.1 biopolymer transporter ExbD [Limnohabitans sp. B9-3]
MAFGRFERAPGQTPMSDINVTPLVDVMMVLLVIFIITAPLMVSALKLDLPNQESAQASSAPPQSVQVAIDVKGDVFLDDKAVSLTELKQALTQRAAQAAGQSAEALPEVQLRADARVPYGRVVEVMDLAQQVGMNRIGFVTERKRP